MCPYREDWDIGFVYFARMFFVVGYGVGKLSKITDKYSTSNEHHVRRLDLAILIVARRARRAAVASFSYFPAAFFLAFVRISSFFPLLSRAA